MSTELQLLQVQNCIRTHGTTQAYLQCQKKYEKPQNHTILESEETLGILQSSISSFYKQGN